MKYIEEIVPGDAFICHNNIYLLTCDFKNNGNRMAISFDTGFPVWFSPETMIENVPLFRLDKDSNIIPIKNVPSTPTNIP